MKPQKTSNGAAALSNRTKSAKEQHGGLFNLPLLPLPEPWPIGKKQPIGEIKIKNKATTSPSQAKEEHELKRKKEEKNIVEKIWSARLTNSNNKAAKAFEILLKLIATLFLLVGVICFAFLAFTAMAKTKSPEEDRYSGSGGPIHDVDYFDTLWDGGSYETQRRMMP